MPRTIEIVRFESAVPYSDGLEAQLLRRRQVEDDEKDNALFLLEHTPVITMGRNAHDDHLLQSRDALRAMGVDVCEAARGGDVTYHGPGQLVAYPILNLRHWRPSIDWYLRELEEVLIGVLLHYGLKGERIEGLTGVWVDGAKVAAIGIGIQKWVTFHGISLNVNPDMSHFGLIVPCGISDKPVCSLATLLKSPPHISEVLCRFQNVFLEHFGSHNSL